MKLFITLCFYILLIGIYAPKALSDSPPLQDVCPMAPQGERGVHEWFPLQAPQHHPGLRLQDPAAEPCRRHGQHAPVVGEHGTEFPGLNTLGLAMARIDIAPSGVVLPHSHPRASEMLFIHGGSVEVGFFDTKGKLFQKTLVQGEVFIFPHGLVHYIMNLGSGTATAFSVLNSQNPGVVGITHAMFATDSDVVEGLMARMLRFGEMGLSDNSTAGFPWAY
ncbi:hypothetical protein HU200_038318 [Digitaria exilis]|uniref:Germin-like protein n=1 Tax=Digitaria exilis TaxID=1010633 RepID=A0A835BCI4_9POAL|nr:hypothetical protein HU200_038318 [Digitaria exilis]